MRKILELLIVICIFAFVMGPVYGICASVKAQVNGLEKQAEENKRQMNFEMQLLREEIESLREEVRANE